MITIRIVYCPMIISVNLSNFKITVLSLLILLAAGLNGAYAQTSGQPVANPTSTDSAKKFYLEVDPCVNSKAVGQTWLDQTHNFVGQKLCEPAVWFDSFFGEEHVLEDVRPGVFIKWKNAAQWTEGHGVDYTGDLHLRLRLPEIEKELRKVRLIIISEFDTGQSTTQSDQLDHFGADLTPEKRKPTIGLRLDFYKWFRSLVSMDAGIRIHMPIDPFVRIRYQYTKPLGQSYLIRFTEDALWRYFEPSTETTKLDLERKIGTFSLLRLSNYATYTEGTAGLSWHTGISLIRELTHQSAISYDTAIWGVSSPEWTIQNYRVGSRYRRNFYRPWLFFELGPEITWPQNESGCGRNPVYALQAAFEIQFGK